MTCDLERDKVIYIILKRRGKIHFKGLLDEIEREYKKITPKVLKKALTRMYDAEPRIVDMDQSPKIGKKRFYWLNEYAKEAMKYDLFQGVRYKRNPKTPYKDPTELEKKQTAYRLLFTKFIRGSLRIVDDGEISSFKIIREGKEIPHIHGYSAHFLSGFLIDDLFTSDVLEEPNVKIGKAGDDRFNYHSSSLTRSEVDEYVNLLREEGIISPSGIREGRVLYEVSQSDSLRSFFFECEHILTEVISRVEKSWQLRKPQKSETFWYGQVFGKSKALEMVTNAMKEGIVSYYSKPIARVKKYLSKKNWNTKTEAMIKKAFQKECRNEIKQCDKLIKNEVSRLRGEEYQITRSKRLVFYNVMMDIVYPDFLSKLYDDKKI